jgi:hypothetical protein
MGSFELRLEIYLNVFYSPFNQISIQIPVLTKVSIKAGYSGYLGNGIGSYDSIHVSDSDLIFRVLSSLFIRLSIHMIDSKRLRRVSISPSKS